MWLCTSSTIDQKVIQNFHWAFWIPLGCVLWNTKYCLAVNKGKRLSFDNLFVFFHQLMNLERKKNKNMKSLWWEKKEGSQMKRKRRKGRCVIAVAEPMSWYGWVAERGEGGADISRPGSPTHRTIRLGPVPTTTTDIHWPALRPHRILAGCCCFWRPLLNGQDMIVFIIVGLQKGALGIFKLVRNGFDGVVLRLLKSVD